MVLEEWAEGTNPQRERICVKDWLYGQYLIVGESWVAGGSSMGRVRLLHLGPFPGRGMGRYFYYVR